MAKITLALVGAGERGQFSYAPYARTHEYELEFVAVADPNEGRRASFQKEYHIKDRITSYNVCYTKLLRQTLI